MDLKDVVKFIFYIQLSIKSIECTCSLPNEWDGTWHDSYRGDIVFNHNSGQITSGWKVDSYTSSVTSFTCVTESSGYFLFKGDSFVQLFSNNYNAYLCMKYTKITDYSYYYYIYADQEVNANNERAFVEIYNAAQTTYPIATYCSPTTNPATEEFHVLVKSGYESSVKQWFPTPLLGNFYYSYNDGSTTTCGSGSEWDNCSNRTETVMNYTQCSTNVLFSTSGYLYNTISLQSGSTYFVSLLNSDSSVTNPTTYQYTCLAVSQSGTTVYVSTNPGDCVAGQTSTVKTTDGGTATLTPYSFATDSETATVSSAGSSMVLIIAAVVAILLIVGLLILGCFLYKKYKKKKEESKIQSKEDEMYPQKDKNGRLKEGTKDTRIDVQSWAPSKTPDPDTLTECSLHFKSDSDMIVEPMTARDIQYSDLPDDIERGLEPIDLAPRPPPPSTPMSRAIRDNIPDIPSDQPSLPPITTSLRPKSVIRLDQVKL